ncbi:MAG: tetratricopeptide repeat protein [Saprospiraceae bacterium]|nr:tetratricopeptide repeat protein [Saprospiraceae bacterium]
MFFKSIFQGNLQFGNIRSFEKVIKMFDHRTENYYKNDVLFKSEDIFKADTMSVEIPRTVLNISDKTWRNTVDLLTYVAQFGVSGNVGVWMTDTGKILKYAWIEPEGDKAVVQNFRKGVALLDEEGKEEEARKLLTQAIEIYDKHSQAYERRGHVNYILKKFHDAERDFNKAIKHDKDNTRAYYGRGRIYMLQEEWEKAIDDFTIATKTSLALQDLHWESRRLKAECLVRLKKYADAEFELRFFTRRSFAKESSNFAHRKAAFFNHGLTLIELEQYNDAIEAFDSALEIDDPKPGVELSEILYQRGIARKQAGKNGFIADWKEASKLGNKKAAQQLESK